MRDYEKKRYKDGLTIIKKLCSKLNTVEMDCAQEILLECQQYLMTLEAELEKELQREDVSSLLSELDQLVHIVSNDIVSDKCIQRLSDGICGVIKQLDEIPCRKIIVFLPYKASMWDAFDSVYQAARSDQRVNVLVMPIPYRSYDKQSDCWHEHYEGESFPSDIKVIDYKNYNLADMEPDYIFIHNPYDQYNYVTRVHEEFFSTKLVEYTEHLVYIPYDVVLGTKIDENFCKMPGVQNAWRVIVQSEEIRQTYIKWINPEKVIALGSPKIDAVVNYKVNWDALPESWKQKCKTRRVFLYNTHLNGIISDGYLLIKRLENVWKYFYEHQDITLLWRPHPLSFQTAEAMNPDFLKAYIYMVEQFKLLDNCIYDDTPDLNRAIGLSDAYMGDYSSLVMLYGFTGKPIYLHSHQNRNMSEFERNSLLCDNGVIYNDTFWMTHNLFNGLFKVDLRTGEAEFVTEIYGENWNQESLFRDIYYYNEKLFLIPQTANHIVQYDVITGEQRSIEIENKAYYFIHFSTVQRYNNYIVMFPLEKPNPIFTLNMEYFTLQTYDMNYVTINSFIENKTGMIFGNSGVNLKKEFWVPLLQNCGVASFSERENKFYLISPELAGIRNLTYSHPYFYLTLNMMSEIIKWNPETGIKERIKVPDSLLGKKNAAIENIVVENGFIWIIPSEGSYIVKYCEKERSYKVILNISEYAKGFEDYNSHMCGLQSDDEYIYLFPYRTNILITINKKDDSFKILEINFPETMDREAWLLEQNKKEINQVDYRGYMMLDSTVGLDAFVNYVKSRKKTDDIAEKNMFDSFVVNADGSAGKHVCDNIL